MAGDNRLMKKLIVSVVGTCIVLASYGVMGSSSCCCSSSAGNSTETSQDKRDIFVDETEPEQTVEVTVSETEATPTTTYDYSETDWFAWYENRNTEVVSADADILFEYGQYYANQTVCTAFIVSDVSTDALKTHTGNDDNPYFFSICAYFANHNEIASIGEGDVVVVIGNVSGPDNLLSTDTVSMYQCHVVCVGSEAETILEEYESQRDAHEEYALSLQAEAEAAAAEQAQNARDAYISSCQQVSYSDVARNPDNYDGMNIYFSGSVIQVSEGWFDSVTLRVSSGGNVWLVDYWRDEGESRVLEGDYVTVYGECTGVSSYLATDLSTVTIPSIDAEIIDVN